MESANLKLFLGKLFCVSSVFLTLSGCEQNVASVENVQAENISSTSSLSDSSLSNSTLNNSSLNNSRLSNSSAEVEFAENLQITYEVVNNNIKNNCDEKSGDGFCFRAAITLNYKPAAELANWRIYFSHLSPVQMDFSQEFNITHYNGDLHYIEPTDSFKGWVGNQEKRIEFNADFWNISEFDSPPNFYLVVGDGAGILIKSTLATINTESKLEEMTHVKMMTDVTNQFKRTANDKSIISSPENTFAANRDVEQSLVDISSRIIPQPSKLVKDPLGEKLDLQLKVNIVDNPWGIDINNVAIKRLERLGVAFDSRGKIPLRIIKQSKSSVNESYKLKIKKNEITIASMSKAGIFYGLQSLASLKSINSHWLPVIEVDDNPRFEFRGLLVDVARNFRNKDFIIKLLDQMAAYKMNKLHLHLGDDEGWRLEISGLEELTQIGARRCHDLTEQRCLLPQLGSGPGNNNLGAVNLSNQFYSVQDYREILIAAKERYIEVIPSFDMPGHSRAAVKSMQARYQKYISLGKVEFANEYLLTDPNDQSDYRSVQFYNDNTLNVCMESTYHFIEKVINEVITQHNNANVPLDTYHIGADETPGAWLDSPACKKFTLKHAIKASELGQYFIQRISNFIANKGIKVAGWSDGLSTVEPSSMPKYVQVNAWGPLFWNGFKEAHTMANHNWQVVVSSPDVTYFDFPYEADPKERGYYWGTRYTNTRQVFQFMPENLPLHAEIWNDRENNPMSLDDRPQAQNGNSKKYQPLDSGKYFKGVQGHLWGEMIRSDDIAEYMLFPRLQALAERAWHKANWEPEYNHQGALYNRQSNYFSSQNETNRELDWREFANTLGQRELHKLELDDWLFRLPTPGAIIENDQLIMNIAFPGLAMQYQIDNKGWKNYISRNETVNIAKNALVEIRSVSPSGKRFSRITRISNSQ